MRRVGVCEYNAAQPTLLSGRAPCLPQPSATLRTGLRRRGWRRRPEPPTCTTADLPSSSKRLAQPPIGIPIPPFSPLFQACHILCLLSMDAVTRQVRHVRSIPPYPGGRVRTPFVFYVFLHLLLPQTAYSLRVKSTSGCCRLGTKPLPTLHRTVLARGQIPFQRLASRGWSGPRQSRGRIISSPWMTFLQTTRQL